MHNKRLISALILIPLFILTVLKGGELGFALFIAVAALLGLKEFYTIWNKLSPVYSALGMVMGGLLCLAFWKIPAWGINLLLSFAVILIMVSALRQVRLGRELNSGILLSISGTLLGLFYVVWLMAHLIWLRQMAKGQELIFMLFLVTCSSDIGAYYVGSAFGRHRLAPQISPGKSVEGAIGGLAGSMLAACLASYWFYPMALWQALFLGLFLSIVAQAGDLAESMLKRCVQVKDSGSIIPGHGGLLDRADSIIFTAPCLYYYLRLFNL